MKKNAAFYLFLGSLFFSIFSCTSDKKVHLFNGENLNNWTYYFGNEDVNPEDIFWVEDNVINVAGVPNGYIRTVEEFSNFKLHVEWRWLEEPKNSGVLLMTRGEDIIWPNSIECQLMNQNAGDIVLIGKGAGVTVRDTTYIVESDSLRYKVVDKFEESSEHAPGEWNSYDITCQNDELEVVVNGILQNKAKNLTMTKGAICLQSEGGPMQFRNIYIIPFEE